MLDKWSQTSITLKSLAHELPHSRAFINSSSLKDSILAASMCICLKKKQTMSDSEKATQQETYAINKQAPLLEYKL